jgi:hypothetical protein
MPTDPFVAVDLDDVPRQEPNLAPGTSLPGRRPGGWWADRPGDLVLGQPSGGLFGSPGPNVGYAVLLTDRVRDRFTLAPHEHLEDAASVVAEVAMRRAASFGRAPVATDVEVAMTLFGYRGGVDPDFARWRAEAVEGASHEYLRRRRMLEALDLDVLRLPPGDLAARVGDVRAAVRASVDASDG